MNQGLRAVDQGTEEHCRGSSTESGQKQGGGSAGGGSSGSWHKQRRRWLVPVAAVTLAQCFGDASLAGAWLEEAQGLGCAGWAKPGLGY